MMEHPVPSISGRTRDVSIAMSHVNLLAIPVVVVIILLYAVPFIVLYGSNAVSQSARLFLNPVVAFPVLIGGIVLHELIHAAAWAFYGQKPLTIIRFGFNWRALAPYAHCPEPMEAGAYRLGALAPGLLLGVIPSIIALCTGPTWLFFAGLIFTLAASGDFLILWILRGVPSQYLVQDHPSRAGCFVYEPTTNEDRQA